MAEAFMFWLMKPLAELAVGLGVAACFVLVVLIVSIPQLVRQRRCKHTRYSETSSCDAICRECGRNLGFIGTVRAKEDQRG